MSLEDFLMPAEEVRFRSDNLVTYGKKRYQVVLTNKRFILYANKGILLKRDEVMSWTLNQIQGIKYEEKGIMGKKGRIVVFGETKIVLEGDRKELKTIYQQLLAFIHPK